LLGGAEGTPVLSSRTPCLLSLSFDDALDCHLDIAAPLLESHGLRGTFYVHVAAPPLRARWREWGALAGRGHELGNHTLLHPAESRRTWVTRANRIEDYTLERMAAELDIASDVLRMIDGQTVRSFAYPCGIDVLGRDGWPRRLLTARALERRRWGRLLVRMAPDLGSTHVNYTSVVEQRFYCARGGGARTSGASLDRYHLPTLSADGLRPDEHGALLDTAAASGPWSVLMWHGIEGGHGLTSTRESFAGLLERILRDGRFVVKPVLEAARDFWG
jgi:peptidoglycan/xylan/chitin deacetylase (PgdA/CDA1 family)